MLKAIVDMVESMVEAKEVVDPCMVEAKTAEHDYEVVEATMAKAPGYEVWKWSKAISSKVRVRGAKVVDPSCGWRMPRYGSSTKVDTKI